MLTSSYLSFLPGCFSCEQPALTTLLTLSLAAPNEFNVHFLLGKLYLSVGDPANASRSFAFALDLDPKMAGAIKSVQQQYQEKMAGDQKGRGGDGSMRDDGNREGSEEEGEGEEMSLER
jgi:anaphase-promoting complex subunit 3